MTKQEFLDELALRLREEGAERLVAENVEYYRSYIDEEVAKGRHEEEVLSELGNPALIARSILDAAGYRVDGVPDRNPDGDLGENAGSYYRTQSEEGERERGRPEYPCRSAAGEFLDCGDSVFSLCRASGARRFGLYHLGGARYSGVAAA